METLMLYVDRRYVIGVQCIDGIRKSIDLPNHEERIWLYFFEDIDHDRIVYGKNNESHYLNKEPHYFGDVFSKIMDSRIEFNRFRSKPIREIFSESGLFKDLKNPFSSERAIDTFVSFSTDIPLAAQSIFLEELKDAGFSVKINVARIEHLALENARNKEQIVDDGQYLVLNACNENLHYSLYDYSGGFFVRIDEDKLDGLGADLRGRALVEEVVKKATIRNKYLATNEELDSEYQRLSQLFLNDWIIRLDNAKQNIPFNIDNVWFANAPNNKQTIQIKKTDIDEHTKAIVGEIVKELGRFVSKAGDKERLKGLILLGDTFSNSMFKKALNEQFNFASKPIVRYKISEIKEIVSTYLNIDCEQFSADTKMFSNNAEAERIRIENAIREEEERKKANKEQEEREQKERAAYDAEKLYSILMEDVYEYESKKDFDKMLESCLDALKLKPNDEEALKKSEDARRYISDEQVKSDQYNNAIKKAKENYDIGQYKDALINSEFALTLRPESSEAKRIKDNSQKVLDTQVRIEKFSTRADLFIGQKLYNQAISELEKILKVDPNNKIAKEKLNEIKIIQQEIDDLYEQLKEAESNEEYKKAISLCEKLKSADSTNIATWEDKIKRLNEDSEKKAREKELLSELREKINSAVFEEIWESVVELCDESLKICPDDDIKEFLKRAQIKLKEENEEKQFQEGLESVKNCITEKKWQEAEDALNKLQKQYPERGDICKQHRKIIFRGQENKETKTRSNKDKDVWFDEKPVSGKKKSSEKNKTNPTIENKHQSSTGIDFFDNDSGDNVEKKSKKKISITDFNF